MGDTLKIPLVCSEIAGLWNSYMVDSLIACVLRFFVNRVEDHETSSILQETLDLCNQHIQVLKNFFNQAELPIPEGFTDKDVDVNAPRLFTDEFYLLYLSNISRAQMLSYSQILSNCARMDIRDYFTKSLNESSGLYNKAADLRLSKGIFTRFPQVEVPKNVEFIKNKNFILDLIGEKRALLVGEITHISIVILANIVGRVLTTGFGQVCKTKEISKYMFRGRDMSSKKIDIYTSVLTSENIPVPSTSYSSVTDSTIAPFSEKLMMYHITSAGLVSIINDGIALSESLRSDLSTTYIRFLTEALDYSKDGADIMINNKWFEQPPQAVKHKNLARV